MKGVSEESFENPVVHAIVKEFFSRINSNKMGVEKKYDQLIDIIRELAVQDVVEDFTSNPMLKEIANDYEEPYLVHF